VCFEVEFNQTGGIIFIQQGGLIHTIVGIYNDKYYLYWGS